MQRLPGRKALVTGAGTGIGREIALEFAREGADVVLHFAHSGEGAHSAAAEVAALGRRATVVQADLDRVEEVARLAATALEFLGGVDCLVNNSGITMNKPILEVTPDQFDRLYHVNVRAQFFLIQAVLPSMLARGQGAIVNLTSVHGFQGAAEHSVYAGTKGAIIAQTRTMAVELAHLGVRVNAIAPGWITVENHFKAQPWLTPDRAREDARRIIPAGRIGVPSDVAKLAVFLCSEDASFLVGETIILDGGTTALMSAFTDFRSRSGARFGTGYVPGV